MKAQAPKPGDKPLAPVEGASTVFASLIARWQERRQAAATSKELLELYWSVSGLLPELHGTELYRQILTARFHDADTAENALRQARESFAEWPQSRPLSFRDIVHWIALSEYLAKHQSAHWTQSRFGRQVARRIPMDL